ncbi:MAG: 2-amino-4-hydroxy-6-hydroxymethyldihydropteridine diphosphokinase [Planctomycetota bacterium]
MHQCLISFGSNLGDRRERLIAAAQQVVRWECCVDFAASRLFETPPIGGPGGQEPFLNAVAAFNTGAHASEVLGRLQSIEEELGRRREVRWAARSIDLDVVLHGDLIGGHQHLVVPHPRYTARTFILTPALDVAGHYQDPRFGWTLKKLSEHLSIGQPSLALSGGSFGQRLKLANAVSEKYDISVIASVNDLGAVAPDRPWILTRFDETESMTSDSPLDADYIPRLIVRIQEDDPNERWPAPHRIWPTGGVFPEYGLELGDFDWAVDEIAAALDSMRCPLNPVSHDGLWWRGNP